MIVCQLIFKPGTIDDEFEALDAAIDGHARSLPGFLGGDSWTSHDGALSNATYYFDSMETVRELARFDEHREAKAKHRRWADGVRVIVSEVKASFGAGLPHITDTIVNDNEFRVNV